MPFVNLCVLCGEWVFVYRTSSTAGLFTVKGMFTAKGTEEQEASPLHPLCPLWLALTFYTRSAGFAEARRNMAGYPRNPTTKRHKGTRRMPFVNLRVLCGEWVFTYRTSSTAGLITVKGWFTAKGTEEQEVSL